MKERIVIIDANITDLTMWEDIIYSLSPNVQCISFVYADEAAEVILHDMKQQPQFIFVDADTARMPVSKFLQRFRRQSEWDGCCIGVFSSTMPSAVVEAYRADGADFAFQKPLTKKDGMHVFASILAIAKGSSNRITEEV
ncbi:hypothetical protein [Dawidia soli]|uniref:Response regulatory domain-containing protein n=1 Tax=Dawidia soli TaxID=2782352 RepID=A0AAP2DCA3_9BACT|nr:hypothetical protein [Dawidia soli]MBT1689461.1 hypothetical protein [Dawidia soli]